MTARGFASRAIPGVLTLTLLTLVALEGGGVAVLRTRGGEAADGIRYTRLWFAEDGDRLWIEAARPGRGFLEDIRREPRIVIERHQRLEAYVAEVQPNPQGHLKVRRLLRKKYGWRDAWIGMLTDTAGSVAILLRPPEGATPLPETIPEAEMPPRLRLKSPPLDSPPGSMGE